MPGTGMPGGPGPGHGMLERPSIIWRASRTASAMRSSWEESAKLSYEPVYEEYEEEEDASRFFFFFLSFSFSSFFFCFLSPFLPLGFPFEPTV